MSSERQNNNKSLGPAPSLNSVVEVLIKEAELKGEEEEKQQNFNDFIFLEEVINNNNNSSNKFSPPSSYFTSCRRSLSWKFWTLLGWTDEALELHTLKKQNEILLKANSDLSRTNKQIVQDLIEKEKEIAKLSTLNTQLNISIVQQQQEPFNRKPKMNQKTYRWRHNKK